MQKMIQILSFLACGYLLPLFELSAQNYLPIVKETAEWTVRKINITTQQDPSLPLLKDTSYVTTWIKGDTSIASIHFKKVFHREFSPGANNPIYQGAIREEDQIVTWIPSGRSLDRLDTLYNFNVKVGDTVAYYRNMSPFYFYVGKMDSIMLNDNLKRKRIDIYVDFVSTPNIEQQLVDSWIEGIGEMQFGLIYPFCFEQNKRCADEFLCYKENKNLVYESFSLACNVTTSTKHLLAENSVKVFPNPFFDVLSLSLKKVQEGSLNIRIYDALGRIIFNNRYVARNKDVLQINLQHLQKGIYYAVVTDESGAGDIKTIIKQ